MIKTPDDTTPVLNRAFDTPGVVHVGVHVDYHDNHGVFEKVNEER